MHLFNRYGLPYSGGYMEQPYNWLWQIECASAAESLARWDKAAEEEQGEGGSGEVPDYGGL